MYLYIKHTYGSIPCIHMIPNHPSATWLWEAGIPISHIQWQVMLSLHGTFLPSVSKGLIKLKELPSLPFCTKVEKSSLHEPAFLLRVAQHQSAPASMRGFPLDTEVPDWRRLMPPSCYITLMLQSTRADTDSTLLSSSIRHSKQRPSCYQQFRLFTRKCSSV